MAGSLVKLFYQAARFDICLHLIANHTIFNAKGQSIPTLAALKQRTSASDRQVASYVALLRQKRLVAAHPIEGDRRLLALEPSTALVLEIARHPLASARGFARLQGFPPPALPAAAPAASFIAAAVRIGILTPQPKIYPRITALAVHDCGYLLLLVVMLEHYRQDASLILTPENLAYSELAGRFDVSKTHVANILRYSRSKNWFSVRRGGILEMISADLVSEFEHLMAVQIVVLGRLAFRYLPVNERD